MADVILAALVLSPAILTWLLKSDAALSFLALCASFVVISFAGTDLQNLTGQLNFSINSGTLNLALLGLPILFTLLFTKRSFPSGTTRLLHIIIALCAGGLLALISVPLLSESVRANFADSKLWAGLQNIQSEVIGAGTFLSLMFIWFKSFNKPSIKDKKRKK